MWTHGVEESAAAAVKAARREGSRAVAAGGSAEALPTAGFVAGEVAEAGFAGAEAGARGDGSFSWVANLSALATGAEGAVSDEVGERAVARPLARRGVLKPEDERFVAEVQRVRCVGVGGDYRRLFNLQPDESFDLPAVQTRYRQMMRLLHPDKRSAESEAQAGGREVCDEAIRLAQSALETAKQELGGYEADPTRRAQEGMRRLQEVQRQLARQAQFRHQQASSVQEVGQLTTEIDRALAEQISRLAPGVPAPVAVPPAAMGSDSKAQKIVDLLAQLAAGPPGAAAPKAAPLRMVAPRAPAFQHAGLLGPRWAFGHRTA